MHYSKIGKIGDGFTNQIIALISSVITAYKDGEKVVVVDNFLNDNSKTNYTPISDIFNIDEINIFLKQNYDIIIIDRNSVKFEIISVKYGTNETNYIDLTYFMKEQYFKNNKLFINKECCFNDIKGDPCPGIVKKLILKYKINENYVEEIYDEYLKSNIEINFDGPYINTIGWINSFNDNMFDKILKNIKYNDSFILRSEIMAKKINTNKKVNVIHLRLEEDGIVHWSRINNVAQNEYREYLEKKYIRLIKTYLSETDENIIVSSSLSNGVIDFLKQNNYNYKFIDKFFDDREKNAIVDLLLSRHCNNIFIGNFNIKNLNGSTFSYYIGKCLSDNVVKIYIDMDRIFDEELVVAPTSLKMRTLNETLTEITNKKLGVEIGGPSPIGTIIYQHAIGMDNVIFSKNTIWNSYNDEYNYYFDKKGKIIINDAVDISLVQDDSYDFCFSSHCLEHIANPLKAINEWLRIIKNGGYIIIVVPEKSVCFDHKRNYSKFSTLLSQFKKNIGEDDLSTLPEILINHDLTMDSQAGDLGAFTKRSLDNFNNRCLHHYVYNEDLLIEICNYFNCEYTYNENQGLDKWFIMKKNGV